MKRILFLLLPLCVVAHALAEEAAEKPPQWSCSLSVGTPKQQSKTLKDTRENNNNRNNRNNRTSEKAITRWMVLPVKVTVSGKDAPTSGFALKSTFIGTRDGEPAILGETTTEVKLENNVFKTELKSPETTLTKTMRTHGRRTTSETTGDKIFGGILQLTYNGKVMRSWTSKPGWAKLAKADTLDTEAILKVR